MQVFSIEGSLTINNKYGHTGPAVTIFSTCQFYAEIVHISIFNESFNNLSARSVCLCVCLCVTPKYLSRGISDVSDRYKPDKKLPYFPGNPC